MPAEICGVGKLDHFKQRVFDHRIRKAGGNIGNRRAFFLRLLYFGIHKYGTACAKVNRIRGKQRFVCKILYTVI